MPQECVGGDVDIVVEITKLGEQVAGNTKLEQLSFGYLLPEIDFFRFLGKWKAIGENWKAVEESGKLLRKAESH